MKKRYLPALLLVLFPLIGGAQTSHTDAATVSFASRNASALEMITAITQQTCVPVGIVPGRNPGALTSERRSFDIDKMPVKEALQQVVSELGYSVEQKNGVYLLTAYDATAQQLDLLDHRFEKFGGPKERLQDFQARLSSWMGTVAEPVTGFAGSILGSVDDEQFALPLMREASVEEIADRIVTLGSKGMWKANIPAEDRLHFSTVGIDFTSYQHYACAHPRKP